MLRWRAFLNRRPPVRQRQPLQVLLGLYNPDGRNPTTVYPAAFRARSIFDTGLRSDGIPRSPCVYALDARGSSQTSRSLW